MCVAFARSCGCVVNGSFARAAFWHIGTDHFEVVLKCIAIIDWYIGKCPEVSFIQSILY